MEEDSSTSSKVDSDEMEHVESLEEEEEFNLGRPMVKSNEVSRGDKVVKD